ncbi:response regulator transcription factor [Streptomyces sp. NBC_00996]|uniref:helix-turn-helix transcriptional regulator n=1 Tax=Streptomyces sp. NBC_00996 TaxID=2903710 RepID=UPI0038678387|nr:LuxR C-terminal-related transcriptional regulator [Streptomyces sp. NBC_00996]
MTKPIAVGVRASDRVTEDGAKAYLKSCPRIKCLPSHQHHEADVLLLIFDQATDATLDLMRRGFSNFAGSGPPVVLVANSIGERQLIRAVEYGLVSFLVREEVDFRQILDALIESRNDRSRMPSCLVRQLIKEVRERRHGGPGLFKRAGLQVREVEVLRMLAEGMGTAEIADKLNYSERTIKGIIHDVIRRLGLRNRTHAVVYAMRAGFL